MFFGFQRWIFIHTFALSYDTLNKCHSRVKQNFISEMDLFSTNILIFEQFSGYFRDVSSEVWSGILKYLSLLHVMYHGDASPE